MKKRSFSANKRSFSANKNLSFAQNLDSRGARIKRSFSANKTSQNIKFSKQLRFSINWRMVWYSIMLWFMVIVVGSVVVLPWYYLVLPLAIFWITVFYFRHSDKTLRMGLWISLIWFLMAAILDVFEIIGPYYMNAGVYFSDFRNTLKYPLILLTPVVYSLILENMKSKRTKWINALAQVNKRVALPTSF